MHESVPCTRAASASSPATTSRARATSACRSSAWASPSPRATSARASTTRAGRPSATHRTTGTTCPCPPSSTRTASASPSSVDLPVLGQDRARPRSVALQAWRVDVGRVPLYLLDANLRENAPEDRALTNTLYGGDRSHRIRQEILLGIGGVRLLAAIGVRPTVCHMNEGHSAFLALERMRALMAEHGASLRGRRRGRLGGQRLHDPHARPRRQRRLLPRARSRPTCACSARASASRDEEVLGLGKVEPGAARRRVLACRCSRSAWPIATTA